MALGKNAVVVAEIVSRSRIVRLITQVERAIALLQQQPNVQDTSVIGSDASLIKLLSQ